MMQSPCVSTLHEFVEKHVVQESTEALDVAQLAELEATVPPVSALLPDDVDQLASDSLQVWNRAVKQGEKDGVQQQLQSLSTGVFLKHFFFFCIFTVPVETMFLHSPVRNVAVLMLMRCVHKDHHQKHKEFLRLLFQMGSRLAELAITKAFETETTLDEGVCGTVTKLGPLATNDVTPHAVACQLFLACVLVQKSQIAESCRAFQETQATLMADGNSSKEWSDVRCLACTCLIHSAVTMMRSAAFSDAIDMLQHYLELQSKFPSSTTTSGTERALRLVATAQLELGNTDTAASVCTLLEEACKNDSRSVDSSTLLVLLRLKTTQHNWVDATMLFDQILTCQELSASAGVAACFLFSQHGNETQCSASFQKLLQMFQTSNKNEYPRALLYWTQHVVEQYHQTTDRHSVEQAIGTISTLTAPNTLTDVDPSTMKQILCLVWDEGARTLSHGDLTVASLWFNCALNILEFDGTMNEESAKCWRILCHCHMCAGDFEAANDDAKHSLEYEPDSLCGLALLFRTTLLNKKPSMEDGENNNNRVLVETLGHMSELAKCVPFTEAQPFFELCAQCAYDTGNITLIRACLETILNLSQGKHLGPVLRCLLKVCHKQEDKIEACAHNLRVGLDKLQAVGPSLFFGSLVPNKGASSENNRSAERQELSWLFSFAWSVAQDALQQEQLKCAVSLFSSANTLSSFLDDENIKTAAKLICSAVMLELANNKEVASNEKEELAKKAYSLLSSNDLTVNENSKLFADALLFKAMALLGQSNHMKETIQKVTQRPEAYPPKLLETYAEIAEPVDPEQAAVCIRAAMISHSKHSLSQEDVQSLCNMAHRLAQCSEKSSKSKEFWGFILAYATANREKWPEISIQWFAATAWNKGVVCYRMANYECAEQWMSTAMSFSKLCPSTNPSDSETMNNGYKKVLQAMGSQLR